MQKYFTKDRSKIESLSFFIAKLNKETQIGVGIAAWQLKNATAPKNCLVVFLGNKYLINKKIRTLFFKPQ